MTSLIAVLALIAWAALVVIGLTLARGAALADRLEGHHEDDELEARIRAALHGNDHNG